MEEIRKVNLIGTLTKKEKETYDLLQEGLTNDEMAAMCGLTNRGIRERLKNIYNKLGIVSSDYHDRIAIRGRAIAYGGNKIVQTIEVSNSCEIGYSEKQIRLAAMRLVKNGLYDNRLVNGLIADLLLILEKKI